MATTKTISANNQVNCAITLLNGGTPANTNLVNSLEMTEVINDLDTNTKVVQNSANGTTKAVSANTFAAYEKGKYVGYHLDTASAISNTSFQSGSAASGRKALHYGKGNYRYHITGWNYLTGAATKGGNAGDKFTYFAPGDDSALAQEPYPTNAVPGQFVYTDGSPTPVMDNYSAKTLG